MPVTSALLTPYGLPHDRRFILLKDHAPELHSDDSGSHGTGPVTSRGAVGNAQTGKIRPRCEKHYNQQTGLENMTITYFYELALFTQEIDDNGRGDTFTVRWKAPLEPGREAVEDPTRRESDTITIPLEPTLAKNAGDADSEERDMEEFELILHTSPTRAYRMPAKYNTWFSQKLGFPAVLAYLGPHRRRVMGNMLPESYRSSNAQTDARPSSGLRSWLPSLSSALPGFINNGKIGSNAESEPLTLTDIAPYLVVTEESLTEVSGLLPDGEEMDVTKFRPNIVISGAEEAWEEDYWAALRVHTTETDHHHANGFASGQGQANGASFTSFDTEILLTSNCCRCRSLNVDFNTGQTAAGDTGKILAKLTKDRRVDKGFKYSPVFGRYGYLDKVDTGDRWVKVGSRVEVARRNAERTTFRESKKPRACLNVHGGQIECAMADIERQNGQAWVIECGRRGSAQRCPANFDGLDPQHIDCHAWHHGQQKRNSLANATWWSRAYQKPWLAIKNALDTFQVSTLQHITLPTTPPAWTRNHISKLPPPPSKPKHRYTPPRL